MGSDSTHYFLILNYGVLTLRVVLQSPAERVCSSVVPNQQQHSALCTLNSLKYCAWQQLTSVHWHQHAHAVTQHVCTCLHTTNTHIQSHSTHIHAYIQLTRTCSHTVRTHMLTYNCYNAEGNNPDDKEHVSPDINHLLEKRARHIETHTGLTYRRTYVCMYLWYTSMNAHRWSYANKHARVSVCSIQYTQANVRGGDMICSELHVANCIYVLDL